MRKGRTRVNGSGLFERNVGGDLLSHTLASAVPSALEGLASGFGMGPGVTPPPQPPTTLSTYPHPISQGRTEHTAPPAQEHAYDDAGCVLRVTQWMRATTLLKQAELGVVGKPSAY